MDNIGLTMPLTTGLISRLTSGLTSISSLIQRLFATFDGTDDFISIPAVTAAGDFVSEFEFSATATGTVKMIAGNSANTLHFITFRTDNTIRASVNNVPITSTGTYTDGKLHAGRLVRVGSSIELYIDEILDGTGTESGGFVLDRIGTFQSGGFYSGTLSNINFLSGWVSSDSAINPRYNLDDPDNVARNSNAALGSNLSETTPNTVNSPWVANGGSSYSIDGTQVSNTNIFYDDLLSANSTYFVSITTSNSTAGGVRPETADIALAFTTGNGTTTVAFATSAGLNFNLQADADFDGDITYTLQEAPGYGTYQNFQSDFSDRELMTLQDNGDWLGSELWDVDNILNDNSGDWSTSIDNIYELNGSAGTLMRPTGPTITAPVQTNFDWVKVSGDLQIGGGAGVQTITASGAYTVTGADSVAFGFKRATGTVEGTLSNVTAALVLEAP